MVRKLTIGCITMVFVVICLASCAGSSLSADDLTSGVEPKKTLAAGQLGDASDAIAELGVSLLQSSASASDSDGVVLVSPLSVEYALAMLANGTQGDTWSQMEDVLGMSVLEANEQLGSYRALHESAGESSEKGSASARERAPLSIANSLWLKEGSSVEQAFLQANADFYGAGVFEAPFDDSTVSDVNKWTSDATDGMIENIIDTIPADSLLYLVNALAFEERWAHVYGEDEVDEEPFTAADGAVQNASMMKSTEYSYIETDDATGFLKPYESGDFAFLALLPEEGMDVRDFVASLDGEQLCDMVAEAQNISVDAWLPKFESSSTMELSSALSALGMVDAFDSERADFSGIADSKDAGGNLYVDSVAHATYVSVSEQGTRAAAATSVGVSAASITDEPDDVKVVHLDRPFVYAIMDMGSYTPVFLGIVRSVQ